MVTDISPEAIGVAQNNARLNNVAAKVRFIQSDLFTNYELRTTSYDIIVSNPPYIATGDIKDLPTEVRCEPRIALDGGKDGLDFYRRIIGRSLPYLEQNGFLILEMGYQQKEGIKEIFKKSGNFDFVDIIKDYRSIDRVIVVKRKGPNG